jgi:environmental stress-induced protein Ves
MRVLRASEHKTTRWKNGGGETTEIAVSPGGAGLDDFDWRVSMARVADDGPFSIFAGVRRTLAVLAGGGVELTIDRAAPIALTRDTPPFAFAADLPTQARLLDGPIVDLNVMVRRDRCACRVIRVDLDHPQSLRPQGREALLICVDGSVRVETPAGEATLAPRDGLQGEAADSLWRLTPRAPGRAYLVEIWDGEERRG